MVRHASWVAALVACCAFALTLSAVSRGSTSSALLTAPKVELEVKAHGWPDRRIVAGATCVGIGGRWSAQGVLSSSHFGCFVQAWHKPGSVSAQLWSRLGSAIRSGNVALLYRLLGLPTTATPAQVNAAGARVLGQARPFTVGATAVDATHVRFGSPPISPTAWAASVNARHALLGVLPGVEAYYGDHHTYAGVTSAKLAVAPYNTKVPANVRIVSAAANSYCVQATAAGTTWAVHGPGGAPVLSACR
jgi:hypothetical protein